MEEATMKKVRKIPIEIEFTNGYEQRFTAAVLKIYSDRKRVASNELVNKKEEAS